MRHEIYNFVYYQQGSKQKFKNPLTESGN